MYEAERLKAVEELLVTLLTGAPNLDAVWNDVNTPRNMSAFDVKGRKSEIAQQRDYWNIVDIIKKQLITRAKFPDGPPNLAELDEYFEEDAA